MSYGLVCAAEELAVTVSYLRAGGGDGEVLSCLCHAAGGGGVSEDRSQSCLSGSLDVSER